MLTSDVNLHHLHDPEITRNFKLSWDVEFNFEPYKIIRTVQGSFSQGNVALFGVTASRQYAYNALLSTCWSIFPELSLLKKI